jgi:hypothetical protein
MMTVSKSASKIIDRDVKCQLVFAISITGEGGERTKKKEINPLNFRHELQNYWFHFRISQQAQGYSKFSSNFQNFLCF